ncbi:NAD(P)-binding protein [Mycena rosella]|uniref:NAD(P)-binding protein n=1 Tax=Mycena rosella TaxID=1033263 RepID=A0AAD7GTR6_MYCRO|nr:NAD(P)-binding protein [Mycena rosella]
MSRIVSVFGATGSAVVEGLIKEGTFTPRAISRNPESEASLKLKARGVEVVKGDNADKESLVNALRGSEAVFAVTVPAFFDATGATPDEETQGKNMVDAAKEVGVKFVVFSSLPSITKVSGGKYKNAVHYDQKAVVEEYLKSSGLANASILLGGFLENYWNQQTLKKTDTGFDIAIPYYTTTNVQAFTWVKREVPSAVLTLLKNYTDPSKSISGKSYPVITAAIPYAELAAMTAKVLSVEVTFTTSSPYGLPPVDEMFACMAEHDGLHSATPVPNPELVALGVKFGTIQEFLDTEVKPRFGQ